MPRPPANSTASVFEPTARRVLVFTLDELSPAFPPPGVYGVSERIRKHPFYFLDESREGSYELSDEPEYPFEENARGYEYLDELGEFLAQFEGLKYVCNPSTGSFRWIAAWHNGATRAELVEQFERQGFEVVPLSYLLESTPRPDLDAPPPAPLWAPEVLVLDAAQRQVLEEILIGVGFVQTGSGERRSTFESVGHEPRGQWPECKLGLVVHPEFGWVSVHCSGEDQRPLASSLRRELPTLDASGVLERLRGDTGLSALERVRLALRLGPTAHAKAYFRVVEDELRSAERGLQVEIIACLREQARFLRNMLGIPETQSRLLELASIPELESLREELLTLHRLCVRGRETRCQEAEQMLSERDDDSLAESPDFSDEEPNWSWRGEENCCLRLAWCLRNGDLPGALAQREKLAAMPALSYRPGVLTIELMALAEELQSTDPSARAWLESPEFRLHCAALQGCGSAASRITNAWLVALSALEPLRHQSVRELVHGSLRELDELTFGSDAAPRFWLPPQATWWLLDEQRGRKRVRHLELRISPGTGSWAASVSLCHALQELPRGVGQLASPDRTSTFHSADFSSTLLSFAQALRGDFEPGTAKRLLADVRKKPESELRIVLSGGSALAPALRAALLRRLGTMARFLRHHEELSTRTSTGFLGPVILLHECEGDREELGRWVFEGA
ncbi:MAG TPA: hypothetical protein VLC09_08035 [Polyangiaceae bacterium]|nr:hypothetical protein [Polyangiaceae bacterium]